MGVNSAALIRKLLPTALLPVLRRADPVALRAACMRAQMSEQELLRDYGHFVTAQLLYEGVMQAWHPPPPSHWSCCVGEAFCRKASLSWMRSSCSLPAPQLSGDSVGCWKACQCRMAYIRAEVMLVRLQRRRRTWGVWCSLWSHCCSTRGSTL